MTWAPREINRVLAWARFDSSGTLLNSFNVDSVTKNSTGNFTVFFENEFTDEDYSPMFLAIDDSTGLVLPKIVSQETGNVQVEFRGGAVTILGIQVVLNSPIDPSVGITMITCGVP